MQDDDPEVRKQINVQTTAQKQEDFLVRLEQMISDWERMKRLDSNLDVVCLILIFDGKGFMRVSGRL